MSIGQVLLTAREFSQTALPFEAELVRGEIVEMPPAGQAHGGICGNIYFALRLWAMTHDSVVTTNDAAVLTERDPDTVRGPDVGLIRKSRLPQGKLPVGALEVPPDLVVEIKSPSNRWPELHDKVGEYLNAGVAEAWLIDPDERAVIVYRADRSPRRFSQDDVLISPATLPDFSVAVADFFLNV